MKNVFLSFIALISFTSCQKKFNYDCRIYNETYPEGSPSIQFSSTKATDKYIKDNTIYTSGGDIVSIAKCTKK